MATLFVFSGYGLMLAKDLRVSRSVDQSAQAIGVLAAVPENEYNTLAQQLDARAQELAAREATIVRAEQGPSTDQTTLLLVALMGAGLFGLILLNFYLDHQRRRSLA